MAWILALALAIAALPTLVAILLRAGLARLRESVRQSWTGLDALLIRRHDLLPELVDLCARHMPDEQEIFERLSRAGTAVLQATARQDVPALAAADAVLRQSLARLLSLTGNYQRLRADSAFLDLRERLARIEASIAEHRERYNSAVNLLNVRCQAFPYRVIARAGGFGQSALFE